MPDIEHQKKAMLEALDATGGNVSEACKRAGTDRRQYYRWRRTDAEFAAEADDIREQMTDRAEAQLMKLIEQGNANATMFYLKTRGKFRGYSTTMIRATPDPTAPYGCTGPGAAVPEEEAGRRAAEKEARRKTAAKKRAVRNKKDYIVRLLKKQGKYTPDMAMQVKIAAQLLVRCDELEEEIASPMHQAVKTEYSREGNERQVVASTEKLYMTYLTQAQRALRALGMNTEGKERKTGEGEGLDKFLSAFGDDE